MKEPRGGESRDRSEQTQSRGHQDAGHKAAFERDREVISVTHGGDGAERPPQRIAAGSDVRRRAGFEMQYRDARKDDEKDGDEGCSEEKTLLAVIQNDCVDRPSRTHRSKHSENASDAA